MDGLKEAPMSLLTLPQGQTWWEGAIYQAGGLQDTKSTGTAISDAPVLCLQGAQVTVFSYSGPNRLDQLALAGKGYSH